MVTNASRGFDLDLLQEEESDKQTMGPPGRKMNSLLANEDTTPLWGISITEKGSIIYNLDTLKDEE